MVYRKIKDGEAKKFANLNAIAFHGNADNAYKEIEKGEFLEDTIRVLEDDEGKFITGLKLFDLDMWLDTQYVKSGGIGDVCSYPEHRRSGNVSQIFDNVLKEMYDDDYVISFLYPFSHPFYRKYGYELCRENNIVTFKTSGISYIDDKSYVKQHVIGSEDDLSEDIKYIYFKYAKQMNFMVDRKGWFWDRKLNDDAFTSKCRTYVCYHTDGTPTGFIKYQYDRKDNESLNASVFDIGFVDRKAFDTIINFLYRLGPNIKEVTFACPPIVKAFEAFSEPWEIKAKSGPGGMMRIINVEKALDVIKMPMIKSTVSIKVDDKDIDANNGVFTIDIDNGKASIIKDNNVRPDMECSIHVLAQLVSGFRCIDDVIHREDIKIYSKHDELKKLFVKKPIHTQDFF